VRLYNRVGPPFVAGSNVGDHLWVGEWDYVFACEFTSNILTVGPKDFATWTGFSTKTNNAAQAPTTLDMTAAQVQVNNASPASTPLTLTSPDDQTIRASIWVRNLASSVTTFHISYARRDGTDSTAKQVALPVELLHAVWHKIEYEAAIGIGPSIPLLKVRTVGSAMRTLQLDACYAGIRSPLEAQALAAFPIHTTGVFGVIGEYASVLGHADQLQVLW
jgi:hypothetical protein